MNFTKFLRTPFLQNTSGRLLLLPLFPVLRPDKSTTTVFEGAARYDGKSLNDVIHQGPKLQQDLV